MIARDILALVGGTPLVEMRRVFSSPDVKILAKLEAMNPGGSIKDRVALAMVEQAEADGTLTPDKTVIEATSGNTGIGLAMVCAVKGYKLKLLMSEAASEERKRIVAAYGAEILLTPGKLGTDGAIEEAYRLAREEPETYVLMDQYNNEASIRAHYRTTAEEIWRDTEGRVTHVVAALGTTGTAMGTAKRLKELDPGIEMVAVEPYPGHKLQGLKNMHESYPPGIFERSAMDRIVHVEDERGYDMARRLAREEGILTGMSAGAAMAAAAELAASLDKGLVVVILPDTGERYMSTELFAPPPRLGLGLEDISTGGRVQPQPGPKGLSVFTIGPSLDTWDNPSAWRRIVLADVAMRHLKAKGVGGRALAGLADLDDRALAASRERGLPHKRYVSETLARIRGLGRDLGLSDQVGFSAASDSLDAVLETCRGLLGRGLAYEKLRSVYFDVLRDKRYGELSHLDADKLSLGKTVDLAAYVKDNPRDFTLLKRATLQDVKQGDAVSTQWGNVRPSWFLQQATAGLGLGPRIDVVLAGETHRFPQLENLRAIWSASGIEPSAWAVVQPAFQGEGGERRGLAALAGRLGGMAAARMWLLSSSHNRPLPYTDESLSMWATNWHRAQEAYASLRLASGGVEAEPSDESAGLKRNLEEAVENDLGLHAFWPVFFAFVKRMNQAAGRGLTRDEAARHLAGLLAVDEVLAVLDHAAVPVDEASLPEVVRDLLAQRAEARKRKDFAKADALRRAVEDEGYNVEDTPGGPRLYRK